MDALAPEDERTGPLKGEERRDSFKAGIDVDEDRQRREDQHVADQQHARATQVNEIRRSGLGAAEHVVGGFGFGAGRDTGRIPSSAGAEDAAEMRPRFQEPVSAERDGDAAAPVSGAGSTDTASVTTAAAAPTAQYSSAAMRMMARMGWEGEGGLGRQRQGIAQPILPEQRLDRVGLGAAGAVARPMPFEARDAPLNFPEWNVDLPPAPPEIVAGLADPPESWLELGPSLTDVSESPFCAQALLDEVMAAKTALDALPDQRRFREARARANPYERIGHAVFQNRAALKLAELDALMGVTSVPLLPDEHNVLYFADICAGPGGFTEYLYWRLRWRAKGWGMTLAGKDDFKLSLFAAEAPSQTFEPLYGPSRSGDVTRADNLAALQRAVLAGTQGRGVALMTADGGINTDGQWNRQELLTRRLVLCEFTAALMCLRTGGTFVCKLFDTFTPLIGSLLLLMCAEFERVVLTKPVQSRPANSERFLVCYGRRPRRDAVIAHLLRANATLGALPPGQDLHAVVPSAVLLHSSFRAALTRFNEENARKQAVALRDLAKYYLDPGLRPPADQRAVAEAALELWQVPPGGSPQARLWAGRWQDVLERVAPGPSPVPLRTFRHDELGQKSLRAAVALLRRDWVCVHWCGGPLGLLVGTRSDGTLFLPVDGPPQSVRELTLPHGSVLAVELVHMPPRAATAAAAGVSGDVAAAATAGTVVPVASDAQVAATSSEAQPMPARAFIALDALSLACVALAEVPMETVAARLQACREFRAALPLAQRPSLLVAPCWSDACPRQQFDPERAGDGQLVSMWRAPVLEGRPPVLLPSGGLLMAPTPVRFLFAAERLRRFARPWRRVVGLRVRAPGVLAAVDGPVPAAQYDPRAPELQHAPPGTLLPMRYSKTQQRFVPAPSQWVAALQSVLGPASARGGDPVPWSRLSELDDVRQSIVDDVPEAELF